ncbi:MAG: phosphatase PAP2 family protein [candidate division Zixibacteria bacterium]|nr:phosphatase PAP2 family protein [candidate division Zixibacteria bacterium]
MKHPDKIRIYPYDRLVIGYCLFMLALILLIGRPLNQYYNSLLFYTGMAVLAGFIIRYTREGRNRRHDFLHIIYPALMFTFFYETAGTTVFLIFDSFYDWQLTTFEKMILGVNPTLYIDRHLLNVWVNEIFSCCYFSYYLMLPFFLLPVFFKKDYEVIRRTLTACCLAFFASYILFFLYPVEGPRWFFAGQYVHAIEGPIFRPMVDLVIEGGAFHGGCMPSSHVAVALVLLMFCFRHYRRVGWVLLPVNIGLAVGTFWGRFHYVSDVIAGAAIGLFSTLLVWKYYDRWDKNRPEKITPKELIKENVS